jgi:hypothetical protein
MLPHTTQVADPFQVVRAANERLDEVGRRVQNETFGHRGRKQIRCTAPAGCWSWPTNASPPPPASVVKGCSLPATRRGTSDPRRMDGE